MKNHTCHWRNDYPVHLAIAHDCKISRRSIWTFLGYHFNIDYVTGLITECYVISHTQDHTYHYQKAHPKIIRRCHRSHDKTTQED